ncbi:MAG TPA: FecR domain-containing protein [Prolixibacteraceae bacterium]|nr:FecR domain-containing protein [Prolixibacteraceae bacterium]
MNKNDLQFWDLIAGKLHNELDSKESYLFEKDLEDQNKQSFFNKSKRIQQGLTEIKQLQKSNKTTSWNTIEKKVRFKVIHNLTRGFMKYAAILIVAFILGIYFHYLISNQNQEIQYAEVEVIYGQTGHLVLFDGTEVWLNSGTKFKYPDRFNKDERSVFIQGEAFFKVTKNKNLPFKVKTGELEVEVLGTEFNVTAYQGEPYQSIVLVEGKVKINNLKGSQMGELTPGQRAVKKEGNGSIEIQNADPYFYTSWKDGIVVFNDEKLGDIAKKLERWYNVEFRFEQEKFKDFKFTGTILRNKPIDQTIAAMEMLAPIRFKYLVRTDEKNVITITNKIKN